MGGKVRFLTQVFFPKGTPGRVAPGWQAYLLEERAGRFTSSSLTSSSELWPQKLHPGLCQGPKDATPSSLLLPTPGHTTHSAHSIHASRVCKRGPSPCASQHTARASQVGLLSARGEGWCPGRIPLFWGVSRPTPLCPLSLPSESLPVRAAALKIEHMRGQKDMHRWKHSRSPLPSGTPY